MVRGEHAVHTIRASTRHVSSESSQKAVMAAVAGNWWQELHERMETAPNPEELLDQITASVEQLGFEYWSYGIRLPLSASNPEIEIFDRYPSGWMDNYRAQNYLAIDPTVQIGMVRTTPIVWSDDLFAPCRKLWDEAQETGLRVGVAKSSWGPAGSYGLLSLARAQHSLTGPELSCMLPYLGWLAEIVHHKIYALFCAELTGEAIPELSAREREVLSWTADGKTAWEVACILGIAVSTVNFHIAGVVRKLNAQNKIQAAVMAASLGLLSARAEASSGSTAVSGVRIRPPSEAAARTSTSNLHKGADGNGTRRRRSKV
jgi:LuxR family transcriptional regulator, quorum-sensing system regulator SolR